MFVHQIGVVSEVDGITCRDVSLVAAALQKQVMRDFAPIWSLPALVSGFGELEDIPIGYWPVIIREDIGFAGAAGIHLDVDGQPFALVQASNSWALTASHEVLEMLADPFGNRLIAGNSIKPGQGRVEYLVEVCDPSEAAEFGYTSNGILVSDFYTPNYFDPIGAPGVRYSFTGDITKPRQVLRGGYLSWHNPVDNHWWQAKWFSGPKPKFVDLGVFDSGVESLRTEIDRRTFRKETASGLPARHKTLVAARAAEKMAARSTTTKAASWRSQIAAIRKRFK